jgi:hypothetical protein
MHSCHIDHESVTVTFDASLSTRQCSAYFGFNSLQSWYSVRLNASKHLAAWAEGLAASAIVPKMSNTTPGDITIAADVYFKEL